MMTRCPASHGCASRRLLHCPPLILPPPSYCLATGWWLPRIAVGLLTVLLLGGQPAAGQGGFPAGPPPEPREEASDLHSLYYSAHLPTDRRLSQDLEQARRLFDGGRYSEGMPLVDRVLEAEEDTFELAHRRASTTMATTLKAAAKQLLIELPPAGVAALELDQGVAARRLLTTAAAEGSLEALRHVAQRYPVTEAAGEALLLVAQAELDAARPGSAAGLYEELATWPKAAAQYGPLLAVRLVWCYAATDDALHFARAADGLRDLNSPTARAEVHRLIGSSDVEGWIDELASAKPKRLAPARQAWLVEGRNATRNPLYLEGGVPHVWPAWQARTVQDYNTAERLEARVEWQRRRGVSWGLVASPIAVGNYVIVRTPTNLVAIDWRTGRRVWETRQDDLEDEENTLSFQYEAENQQSVIGLDPLEQRLWIDAVYGAVSSDGDRVYAIRNLDSVQLRVNPRFRARLFGAFGDEYEESGNTLTAYELRTEGKRLWEISGETNEHLAGCFFLGAPLAVGDSLFVIAEFAHAIHLVQLDAGTGALEWKQPLANLERSVIFDIGRRLAGATPTYAGGLIYCPTGAGSVVAIDPVGRAIEWAFRFEVDEEMASRANSNWQRQFGAYQPSLARRWQRNRVIATSGMLLVTTPECEELYCLDANTGEKRWSVKRGDHQYLAGVVGEHLALVGPQQVTVCELATGQPREGNAKVDLPAGSTAAGLALLAGPQLLVPLSDNRIAVLDMAEAKLQRVLEMREGHSVGNLAFHRGALISKSATSVVRYDQLAVLQQQLAEAKARGELDAQSLRIEAEMAWGEGRLDEAIGLLLSAHQQDSEDDLVRLRLTTALAAGLRADYARYRRHSELLAALTEGTDQRLELFRFNVVGALESGDPAAALRWAWEIYDLDSERLVNVADGHDVQAERWFAARMAEIWEAADAPLRESLASDVDRLYQDARQAESAGQLSRLVRYFGTIPAGQMARRSLAEQWAGAGRAAEAELLLATALPASGSTDQASQPTSWELVSAMFPGFAPPSRYTNGLGAYDDWPDGKVETDVSKGRVESATPTVNGSVIRTRARSNNRLLLNPRWCGMGWTGPKQLAITYGSPNQLMGWNDLGEVTHGIALQLAELQNPNNNVQVRCIRFGNFAILGVGQQVVAVDLRGDGASQGPVLWVGGPQSDPQVQARMLQGIQFSSRGISRAAQPDEGGDQMGELCTAAPLGVVLRADDQLRCYDPVGGELLWRRRDMPTSGPTFGDLEHLFVVADGAATGLVLSLMDGSTVGEWQKPEGKVIAECGRHQVVTQFRSGRRVIRVVDVLEGRVLLERDYSSSAEYVYQAPDLVVVMEPSGQVEALDLEAGELKFSQQLEEEKSLESIHLLPAGEVLVLCTNKRSAAQHNTAGNEALDNAPVVSGRVYALDATTGEPAWPQPATVKGQGLWTMQPPGSPVLMFISRYEDRASPQKQGNTRLLCLDKRTGRSLLRRDNLRQADSQPWAMQIDHQASPLVTIDLRHSEVTLRFTDAPRPPEPVALAEVEDDGTSSSRGILGILFGGGRTPDPPEDD